MHKIFCGCFVLEEVTEGPKKAHRSFPEGLPFSRGLSQTLGLKLYKFIPILTPKSLINWSILEQYLSLSVVHLQDSELLYSPAKQEKSITYKGSELYSRCYTLTQESCWCMFENPTFMINLQSGLFFFFLACGRWNNGLPKMSYPHHCNQ